MEQKTLSGYGTAKIYQGEETSNKEATILENLIGQFEKSNAEQSTNTERIISLQNKLNLNPPVPEGLNGIKKPSLTSGEGLLPKLEYMVSKYQETISIQSSVIYQLERLL